MHDDQRFDSYVCSTRGHHWSAMQRRPGGPPWEELSRCRRPGCGAMALDRIEMKTLSNGDVIPFRRFFLMVAGSHREMPCSTYEVKVKPEPLGGTDEEPRRA